MRERTAKKPGLADYVAAREWIMGRSTCPTTS